eukprot:TRINITY_DN7254_c0_g1_i4.p1 TRINITY_DN7254_c0_g1~~TRINITY_DN7254_c0_g1_i4.p1  ORF type:complete len:344 (-),score=38.69 TRINITY_DN7254_c0_g1_i4:240-1271(-)
MIDVVYRHTSWDSILMKEHPEWYKRDKGGTPCSSNPHWTDIVDLDWTNPSSGLWEHLSAILCYWSSLGVDGFRCDVGNVVPIEFWKQARLEVSKVNYNTIWLCESWNLKGIESARESGELCHSDSELYPTFDITYDYDLWPLFRQVLKKEIRDPKVYLQFLRIQSVLYSANSCKLRFVENHDQDRIFKSCTGNLVNIEIWTAFTVFNRGPFLLYSGQESKAPNRPSLFERDPICWKDYEFSPFLQNLFRIKKKTCGTFKPLSVGPVTAVWYDQDSGKGLFGIFDDTRSHRVKCDPLPDGTYVDLLNNQVVTISGGWLRFSSNVVIIEFVQKGMKFKAISSPLF